jgi:hypothetical protein
LDVKRPEAAKAAYDTAQPSLIKAKQYELCGKYVDGKPALGRMVQLFRLNRKLAAEPAQRAEFMQFTEKKFTNDVATLVAILAVNGRKDEAEDTARAAKAEWEDAGFHAAIDQALEGKVPEPWP